MVVTTWQEDRPLEFYEALMVGVDPPLSLADLLRRPAWMANASCRGRDDIDWQDPEPGPDVVAVCQACPVLEQCAQHAGVHREIGTWAGMSERARLGRRHSHCVPRGCS